MGYLYFLVATNGQEFKIGASLNPERRLAQLPESIDIVRSYKFTCGEPKRAEKVLHLLFKNSQIVKSRGDGFTEWFSMDCFDLANKLIADIKELLGLGAQEPINFKSDLDVEQKAQSQNVIDKAEKIQNLHLKENIESIDELTNWISLLENKNILLGKFETNLDGINTLHLAVINNSRFTIDLPKSLLNYTLFRKNGKPKSGFSIVSSYVSGSTLKYSFFKLLDQRYLDGSPCDTKVISDVIDAINFVEVDQLLEVKSEYYKSCKRNSDFNQAIML